MEEYIPIIIREDIEKQYGLLTDNQWSIVLSEVDNRDTDEDPFDVVADVCQNILSYEQEYADWQSQVSK